jgi:hypothetical protein
VAFSFVDHATIQFVARHPPPVICHFPSVLFHPPSVFGPVELTLLQQAGPHLIERAMNVVSTFFSVIVPRLADLI